MNSNAPAKPEAHVVVIGGSMAGLLAARVLSARFSHVTLFERDRCSTDPVPRPGVPQARHVHALLLRGLMILEELFPDIRQSILESGGELIDIAQDFAWLTPAGWAPRFKANLSFLAASRPLIESVVRRRVMALSNVDIVPEVDVSGLVVDSKCTQTCGVMIRLRNSDRGQSQVSADLVVDASGRDSGLPEWLEAAGWSRPPETIVDGHLGYASRIYARKGTDEFGWRATYSQAAPPQNCRTGLAMPIEGDRWIVSLAGGGDDYPPTDPEGFAEFAKSLPNPNVYRVVNSCEPLSPIHGYRRAHNRIRHYDRIRLPEGLIVLGDSTCAFNPVYGQGMTTAAIGAQLLDDCLRTGKLARFQKNLARALEAPWMFATSEDIRYPGAEGAAVTRRTRFMHWYIDRALALSVKDHSVRRSFLEVLNMLKGPSELFRPAILAGVLTPHFGDRLHNFHPDRTHDRVECR